MNDTSQLVQFNPDEVDTDEIDNVKNWAAENRILVIIMMQHTEENCLPPS